VDGADPALPATHHAVLVLAPPTAPTHPFVRTCCGGCRCHGLHRACTVAWLIVLGHNHPTQVVLSGFTAVGSSSVPPGVERRSHASTCAWAVEVRVERLHSVCPRVAALRLHVTARPSNETLPPPPDAGVIWWIHGVHGDPLRLLLKRAALSPRGRPCSMQLGSIFETVI
jgi:hypothetical protein